eukprot:TRINITY_DN6349_c0_g1_i2.p1 TRINITY_DN6349_c0_g1~~TRINITY_DN6349_c0_g1_i2.p1  ORF type:complete len:101 (+),score=11.08 TRINITY_DN6349_c0_g1_i2:110-412(+)
MKVIALLCLLVALTFASELFPLRSVGEKLARQANPCSPGICGSTETCCNFGGNAGCCPALDACCCPDQAHCCPSGKCVCSGSVCTGCASTGGTCVSAVVF